MSLRTLYQAEVELAKASMAMTSLGLPIDEQRRTDSIAALEAEIGPLTETFKSAAMPLIEAAIEAGKLTTREANLFRCKWTCPCCRGGAKKAQACWSCAGLEKAPKKKDNITLSACAECDGEGRREWLDINPDSGHQLKLLLYKIAKLPKKMKGGKLTTDEDALRKLLPQDRHGIVKPLITIAKHTTAAKKFRFYPKQKSGLDPVTDPPPDGRFRTFMNPAGTETGRFAHSGGRPDSENRNVRYALEYSTNGGNLPKKQVARNKLYDVRRCIVPEPGHAIVEADLSQAEARVVAALCRDEELLERWQDPDWDIHKWTASSILGVSEAGVTKTQRDVQGKRPRHALNYGMGVGTLYNDINADADLTGVTVNMAEAREIFEGYHNLHPSLRERWWKDVFDQLEATGTLTTPFGRRRMFFGQRVRGAPQSRWLDSVHKEAIAYVPQSTIADHLNINGLLSWWRQYHNSVGTLRLQVHDAVIVMVPLAKLAGAARLLKRCLEQPIMVNGIELLIPADVSYSETSWGEMEKMEL